MKADRFKVARWLLLAVGLITIGGALFFSKNARQPPPAPLQNNAVSVPLDAAVAEPPPLAFQPYIAPEDAAAINAARPDYVGAIAVARPFIARHTIEQQADYARATDCLTQAIYYEAASESLQGQRAVAQVVLNRVRDPRFPASVCGVVFQGSERNTGCQFSFTCDGALSRQPIAALYERAHAIAVSAMAGRVESSVGLATHYHTYQVVPVWRTDLVKLRTVGAHIFYAWQGRQTSSRGLRSSYAGVEPVIFPNVLAPELSLDDQPLVDPEAELSNPFAPPVPQSPLRAPKLSTSDFGRLKADEKSGELLGNQVGGLKADSQSGKLEKQ